MGRFEGKVAFITGAGRGQGRALAVRLAGEGAAVALVDVGGARAKEASGARLAGQDELRETQAICERNGGQALVLELDVRDHAALERAAAHTAEALGGIDLVVTHAGITGTLAPTWEIPVETWNTMIDINLTGTFYTVRATVPHVRRRGPGGAIVLVSSNVVSSKAVPHLSHYVAAKSGVRHMALALAKELGPDAIRVNSFHPGSIHTYMTEFMAEQTGRSAEDVLKQFREGRLIPLDIDVEDSAAAVAWLLSDEARGVTGTEFYLDGGSSRN